jgi:hypothetical protein
VFTRRGFLLALIAGSLPACGGSFADWVSLDRTLNSPEAVSIPFSAKYGGNHQVVLEFAWPIPDVQVEAVVNSAAATTGLSGAPAFDFSWQLRKEGQVVARREGPQRSTGVRETRTSGLGEGPLTSLGLVFGGFDLEAGNEYTSRVLPGSDLSAIIGVTPRVVVVRQPYTLSVIP